MNDISMILDRWNEVIPPSGYLLIETEVEFLRLAGTRERLCIRGSELCDWAEAFCRCRDIKYWEQRSPAQELSSVFPELDQQMALSIYGHLRDRFDTLDRPLTAQTIMQAYAPQRMWHDVPSTGHAGAWLTWLIESEVPEEFIPILRALSIQWQHSATETEKPIYQAVDRNSAVDRMMKWLRIVDPMELRKTQLYSGPIPESVLTLIEKEWLNSIVVSRGQAIEGILSLPIRQELKFRVAKIAAGYFEKHVQYITAELLQLLSPHIDMQTQRVLRRYVRPAKPGLPPSDPIGVLTWFRDHYLPYRAWAVDYGSEEEQRVTYDSAEAFAIWFLQQYPKALVGNGPLANHLTFNRSVELKRSDDPAITFVIVLDGLHVEDGRYVLDQLKSKTKRMTLAQDILAFVPLPTVTEFCKDALLKGTTPVRAPDYQPLGTVLPEKQSPIDVLQRAEPGQVYWWRVQEPDATYHSRNAHELLIRDVQAQLDGIVQKIVDVIDGVSAGIPLRIVITTDHGRLLARSERKREVPPGMQSHGRAAWGEAKRSFSAEGYAVEDGMVFLHRDKFGLRVDAVVSMTEDSFRTNDGRGGSEVFPHGGLYPEEVIVPWYVLVRDLVTPEIRVELRGQAQAKTRGQAMVKFVNLSELQLFVKRLYLHPVSGPPVSIETMIECSPTDDGDQFVSIDPWPTQQMLEGMTCSAEVALPAGNQISIDVMLNLSSEEMYTTNESILEGMDLI